MKRAAREHRRTPKEYGEYKGSMKEHEGRSLFWLLELGAAQYRVSAIA